MANFNRVGLAFLFNSKTSISLTHDNIQHDWRLRLFAELRKRADENYVFIIEGEKWQKLRADNGVPPLTQLLNVTWSDTPRIYFIHPEA